MVSEKRYIQDMAVVAAERVSPRTVLLKLQGDERLGRICPGQFVQLRVDGADVLLRRPISIHYVDETCWQIWLLIQEAGRGTERLARARVGQTVNVMLPLGHGFDMVQNERVLIVGGGVGVAPLLYLAKQLRGRSCTVDFIIGARTADELITPDNYRLYGNVSISTDDGSCGHPGFVTQNPTLSGKYDSWYVCGPTPMMRSIAQLARERSVRCQLSLENHMACGLGACLCCVTKDSSGHHRCVCTEGPVFDAEEVDI